jgi:Lon-like ATP-dependent protease
MNESTAASPARNLRSGYKAPETGSVMKPVILVSEQDIINTYSEKDRLSCKKYAEYIKLVQENPTIGYKKAAKLLGVKQGSTRWWHTEGEKKAIPNALKVVHKLKRIGLIPFTEKHKAAKTIFNILGTLFGDGGIDCRFNTVAFISSDKRDVDLWCEDLLKIFPFAQDKTQLVEGGEYGHSYNFRCYDRAVVRFFAALGAPVGDKVATKYSLPKFIFDLSFTNRIAFLDGLLAAEVAVPRFKGDPRWSWTKRFCDFSLGLSKIDALEQEHRAYLVEVKRLCATIGLTTTPNLRKELRKPTYRKDGNVSYNYRIFFQTHHEKVLAFNEKFDLRYAKDKKARLETQVQLAKEHKE